MVKISQYIYSMLYTLKLYSDVWQLLLNKTGKSIAHMFIITKILMFLKNNLTLFTEDIFV